MRMYEALTLPASRSIPRMKKIDLAEGNLFIRQKIGQNWL
jgi:hypothetical protein